MREARILRKIEKMREYLLSCVCCRNYYGKLATRLIYIWMSQEIVQAVIQDHRSCNLFHGILRRHESPVKPEILQHVVIIGPEMTCKKRENSVERTAVRTEETLDPE